MDYYLDQHRDKDAKRIAEDAASTYSAAGLAAMGHYCERTGQVDEAVKWFEKIDRRYEGHREVLFLALRILSDEGDPKVVARFRSVVQTFRPKTLIPVKVAELTASPALGVQFGDDSPLLTAHGLKKGDVIVAVYGFRVENATEYAVLRESTPQTNLVLIVWDGKGYREIDANLPNRRFGAMVQDYTPQ